MKHFLTFVCLLVLGAVAMTSCDDKKKEPYAEHPIVGTWHNTETITSTNNPSFQEVFDRTMTFNATGNCTLEHRSKATGFPEKYQKLDGTFEVNGNHLTFYYMENGKEKSETSLFEIKGSKLILARPEAPTQVIIYNRTN